MLKRVDPLRSELKALEESAETTRIQGEEMKKIVLELEDSIAKYKEEYAVLISEANAIKSDLSTVEAKVRERKGGAEIGAGEGGAEIGAGEGGAEIDAGEGEVEIDAGEGEVEIDLGV
jgi:hypothetical protein